MWEKQTCTPGGDHVLVENEPYPRWALDPLDPFRFFARHAGDHLGH